MITYNFPVVINGRWTRAIVVSNKGNKYEVLNAYIAEQAAKGVRVQGHDMSQCWTRWN